MIKILLDKATLHTLMLTVSGAEHYNNLQVSAQDFSISVLGVLVSQTSYIKMMKPIVFLKTLHALEKKKYTLF